MPGLKDIAILEEIGKGNFSTVYKARKKLPNGACELVAVKKVDVRRVKCSRSCE
jgi:hypothetical protein